ncbi:MAG: hypothetical protein GWP10_12150 [Nitrospiraceae bacterium]|nr:hypothetical protein [Nitrospiraceae bacterium]
MKTYTRIIATSAAEASAARNTMSAGIVGACMDRRVVVIGMVYYPRYRIFARDYYNVVVVA